MQRREAILRLLGVGAATAVVPALGAAGDKKPPRFDPFENYLLHFTGWKPSYDGAMYVGQWLAWPSLGFGQSNELVPDREPYLYLNVPGMIGGLYAPGDTFNVSNRQREPVLWQTSERERQALISEGREYIEQLVRVFQGRSHRAMRYRCPLYNFPLGSGIGIIVEDIGPEPEYTFGFTGFKP